MPPTKKRPEKKGKKAAKEQEKEEAVSEIPADASPADILRSQGIIATYALTSKSVHRNVRDISVSNLTVTFHGTPLIEETELTLNYGNRYGYIGRNGCGKSTFMKVIAARCFPIPDGIDIFHLSEEIEATDMTAKEAVMSVDVERSKLDEEAEMLNEIIASQEGSIEADEAMERLTQVYERLEEMDASTAETRASKILSGLGFTPQKQQMKTREFSGGWRMRIALARALFIQPTLLLLDEPTNHLDMEAVVWLEDYLSKWNKILFMVSHSQDFMNSVCTHIVNHTKKSLVYYSGNYDTFVRTRAEKEEEQEKRYKQEQDQIKHMKNYVAKFGQGNAKMAKQAQSKEKVLDKMLKSGLTDKVQVEKALDFKFLDPGKLAPPVLQCNDISFGYPGCPLLYSNVDFGVDLDSRIALVGPNGAGKSTLLKLMTGDLIPVTGTVRPHAHLKISKFSQHFVDVLDLSMNPLDYFLHLFADMTREEGRKFLGRYGISGSVQTQVMSQLSDGQKSRVVLAKMARENPHFLFLDEPTNHLDMESIDSLAKAINGFSGGMVLVSHDMRLISQVAREIWLCDKSVTKFMGEISDFKMHLRREMQKQNIIDADSSSTSSLLASSSSLKLAPIVPTNTASTSSVSAAGGANKKVVLAPPAIGNAQAFPSLSFSTSSSSAAPAATGGGGSSSSTEDSVLQARLELAELAIARQRARKAQQQEGGGVAPPAPPVPSASSASSVLQKEKKTEGAAASEIETEAVEVELDEKAIAKAKRKAEKEAALALQKREEEERVKRREEKLREAQEAMQLREKQEADMAEFRAMKAAKEAKRKAAEDAEAARAAEALAQRKAEKEARKKAKIEARIVAQEAARAALEREVLADVWTQEQQVSFETALLTYTCTMDKLERWTCIEKEVPGKTKNQCIARYRYLKEFVLKKKHIAEQTA